MLLLGAPALAQAPAADALFEQGRAAMTAGDVNTACARFRESDRLDPQPGTRANLGNCEEKRGRIATAWEALRTALEKMPPGDSRVAYLQQRIKALEPRLPKLTLRLSPGAPAETTVREGDTTIGTAGTFGVPLPFDPGPHKLTVQMPGRAPRTLDVTLTEGKSTEVTVEAGPPDAASSPVGPAVLLGVGGAGLVAGLVTGILLLQKKSTAVAHCSETTLTCSAAGKAAEDAGASSARPRRRASPSVRPPSRRARSGSGSAAAGGRRWAWRRPRAAPWRAWRRHGERAPRAGDLPAGHHRVRGDAAPTTPQGEGERRRAREPLRRDLRLHPVQDVLVPRPCACRNTTPASPAARASWS